MLKKSQEWLDRRLKYITGSDVSTILGINPWGNIVDLWKQKVGLSQAQDISHKPSVKAGIYLEPAIRQWFMNETHLSVETELEFITHPTIPFLAGNIDGFIPSENAIFEAKTSSRATGWGEVGEDVIPDYYLCQVAHYMACKEADSAMVAVLIGGTDFRIYTIKRNLKLEELIIQKCSGFWECVENETPPVPRTSDEVISLHGYQDNGDPITATHSISAAIAELKDIKADIKEAQDKQRELETKVKVYMGEHGVLVDPGNRPIATWKTSKAPMKFDVNKFKLENKDMYNEYVFEGTPSRPFLIK